MNHCQRSGLTFAILALLSGVAIAQPKPNILVIWGDDIGTSNISFNNRGLMGYQTPNIDRIAREGVSFTDYYGQQSCTAGRAAFLGGNNPLRTGMTKVGVPGALEGWQKSDVTIATVLKSQGYATGQFGKNHQGDRDAHLPTMHGFDEFFERRGGTGERRLSAGTGVSAGIRPARRDQGLGGWQGRSDHRRHRAADEETHGNNRR